MKVCSRCGVNKSVYKFSKYKSFEETIKCYCNECERIAGIIWRNNNIEKEKERKKMVIIELPDYHIKGILKKLNYPQELIDNPEIIEVKRLIIKTKRLCKT